MNRIGFEQDISTAANVGSRHRDAVMVKDGFKFFLSKNNIWLTDFVSVKYIEIINR